MSIANQIHIIQEKKMTKKDAEKIVGKLYKNDKMPCKSYTLPAGTKCPVGSTLMNNPNSTCAGCYALKGFSLVFAKNVNPFREFKLAALNHPQWVEAMVAMIGKDSYFRWHDSGDIQSLDHFLRIVLVCYKTPHCKHWLPTREYNVIRQYLAMGGVIPENLTVRLSGYMVDCKPPQPNGLVHLTTSTVHDKVAPYGMACNAPSQGGHCLNCRACWSDKVQSVSYHKH